MSESVLLWILGGLLLAFTAIAGALWRHVEHCKEVHTKLAEIGSDVRRIKEDIGTHETGMRGTVHKCANRLIEHEARLVTLERK